MKAARNKIAEQAKQRDCTQRMETPLLYVNDSQCDLITLMYSLQKDMARKPLSKTHSVLISDGKGHLFDVFFEIHQITAYDAFKQITAVKSGNQFSDLKVVLDSTILVGNSKEVTSNSENQNDEEVSKDDN